MSFLDDGAARLTSSLNEARNDTGRIAFCGPIVLSAITGYSVSKVEEEIRAFRESRPSAGRSSGAPTPRRWPPRSPISATLMELKESYMHLARKERPSLWTWMQKPRNAWVALHPGHPQGQGRPLGADQGREAVRHLLARDAGSSCATAPTRAPHHGGVRGEEGVVEAAHGPEFLHGSSGTARSLLSRSRRRRASSETGESRDLHSRTSSASPVRPKN